MPALTHNRVKNGFNGGNKTSHTNNKCATSSPTSNSRPVKNCAAGDAERRNARIGGLGSRNASARAAIRRRVPRENKSNCK
jgi:hypothetical protein